MMLVPFALVIRCSVSSREEAFLARKFGYVYCRYRAPGPKACSPIRLQPAFTERGEARQLTRWSSVSRNAPSLGHEARYVPSDNAILIANRAHFGEILNEARSVGLRLREQSRPQTKAFDGQPWIPDGLGDGKSSLQGGQPALRFPVPHEGFSIARMQITHLNLARPQMHPAFYTGLYQADGLMRFACACQRGRQCSAQVGVDGIVAVAFDNLLTN